MTEQEFISVLVRLDPGSDPITGRIETTRGDVEFTGWLGFASALERAMLDEGPAAPRGPARPSANRGGRI